MAFSCCVYDGGVAERIKMEAVREEGWGDKFKRQSRVIEPGLNRINGKCPMTPVEVSFWYFTKNNFLSYFIFHKKCCQILCLSSIAL